MTYAQKQQLTIERLEIQLKAAREVLEDVAGRRTLSEHCGELDYIIDDAKAALKK